MPCEFELCVPTCCWGVLCALYAHMRVSCSPHAAVYHRAGLSQLSDEEATERAQKEALGIVAHMWACGGWNVLAWPQQQLQRNRGDAERVS